jgi:phospholipase C
MSDKKDPKSGSATDLQRRKLMAGVAAAAGVAMIDGCGSSEGPSGSASGSGAQPIPGTSDPTALPNPADSGIEHIIVVMMENRSFDHYLGWLPGADGKQAGLSYTDANGKTSSTYPLAPEFQGCAYQDPDHSHEGGLKQYNNGKNDGFLLTSPDIFPIGYYRQEDLPFHGQAATAWTTYDRYFCGILAETYPNRFYMHSAQTPVLHNSEATSVSGLEATSQLPAIWDKLSAAGLTGTYYFSDIPFTALYGAKYLDISQPFDAFLLACEAGTLPNVSYIDPAFEDEGSGTSKDDHPFADIRNGQAFLNQIYSAVTSSPLWSKTALFITYDEWGGFFDHVPPPMAGVIPAADLAAFQADNETPSSLLGFRVPTLTISPYARRGYISNTQYDHTSILKMIEWRWNLTPLTVRDTQANNIARSFDFSSPPNLEAPSFNVPTGPFGETCSSSSLAAGSHAAAIREQHFIEYRKLRELAIKQGFMRGRS